MTDDSEMYTTQINISARSVANEDRLPFLNMKMLEKEVQLFHKSKEPKNIGAPYTSVRNIPLRPEISSNVVSLFLDDSSEHTLSPIKNSSHNLKHLDSKIE